MKRLLKSYTRRDILKVGAVSAFAINYFPSRVFGANERLAVAAIGAGGKGRADIAGSAAAGADIVALCDVDPRRGADSFKKYPMTNLTEISVFGCKKVTKKGIRDLQKAFPHLKLISTFKPY